MVGIRRQLTEKILEGAEELSPQEAVARYLDEQAAGLARLDQFLDGLGPDQPDNLAPLMIGVRQLRAML